MHIFESLATSLGGGWPTFPKYSKIHSLYPLLCCFLAVLQVSKIVHQRSSKERAKKFAFLKGSFRLLQTTKKMCIFIRKTTLKVGLELAIFVIFIHDIIPSPCLLKLFIQFDTFQYILMHFNFRILNETFL